MMSQRTGDLLASVSGQTATVGYCTTTAYTYPYDNCTINWVYPINYSCSDKGRAAINIIKKFQEKKIVELKTAKQVIDAIDAVMECL